MSKSVVGEIKAMKITVDVKPGAKKNDIEKTPLGIYTIWTVQQAHDGKANEAVCEILAAYFNIAKSRISIIRGFGARKKIIEIMI